MGLMDKFKNLFTEEVEEEIKPIKRETRQVEIEIPKREEIKPILEMEEPKIETISDTPILRREERPKMPVYFDDDAFADLKQIETKKEQKIESFREKKDIIKKDDIKSELTKEFYKGTLTHEEKKTFRPSLIISPVYGVLDKNYHKDDIAQKEEKENEIKRKEKPTSITIDDIRNKAYGTLEDDLETNMFVDNAKKEYAELDNYEDYELKDEDIETTVPETRIHKNSANVDLLSEDFNNDEETNVQDTDLSKELARQKQKIEEINEFIKNNTAKKVQKQDQQREEKIDKNDEITEDDFLEAVRETESENLKETINEEIEEVNEEPQENERIIETYEEPEEDENKTLTESKDDGVESELFDLIDSMYEKRDEE